MLKDGNQKYRCSYFIVNYKQKIEIMKVFISWSGKVSKEIGEEIKNWLPAVLQNIKPYFTPNDIEKGSRWSADITKELEISKLGIFIYTKENLASQWMLFEAGAISKTLDSSKVCPILFGLDNSDFTGPLTQFQTSQFNKGDFKKLIRTINNSQTDGKLEEKVLDEVFDMWWPKLESKITRILESNKVKNVDLRDDRDILEEILAISRTNLKMNRQPSQKRQSVESVEYSIKIFELLTAEFLDMTEVIFSHDWDFTKECLNESISSGFIHERADFLNPNVENEGNNWANRGSYLQAYRRLKSFINQFNIGRTDHDDILF